MMPACLLILSLLPIIFDGTLGDDDKIVELYLYKLGFLQPAEVTPRGVHNSKDAIMHFQKEERFKQTGVLDEDTWKRMILRRQAKAIQNFQNATGYELTKAFVEKTYTPARPKSCGIPEHVGAKEKIWKKRNLTYKIDKFWKNPTGLEITPERTRELVKEAFAAFSEVTPLHFTEVFSGESDMKISFEEKVHDDKQIFDGKGGVLAHTFPPGDGRIHFDDEEWWQDMKNLSNVLYKSAKDVKTDFLTIAIHEIGHAVGLGHARNKRSIMSKYPKNPIYETKRRNLIYRKPGLDKAIIKKLNEMYGANAPTGDEAKYEMMESNVHLQCTDHLKGTLSLPGYRIAFFTQMGKQWVMFNSESLQMIQNVSVSEIFIGGPSEVSAAYYNEVNETIVLFHEDRASHLQQVWAFHFDWKLSEVVLAYNYPKNLTDDPQWHITAAFLLKSQIVLVSNNLTVAFYNEAENKMEVKGYIEDVFKNIPIGTTGFAKYENGTFVGFTKHKVFKYDTDTNRTTPVGIISDLFNCLT